MAAEDGDSPFERVQAATANAVRGAQAKRPAKRDLGAIVLPVPEDAPRPEFDHFRYGAPAQPPWPYRDARGRLLGYVVRFPKAAQGEEQLPREQWTEKDVLPLTFWRKGPRAGWQWAKWPAPAPLYGLDALAARPSAPVLVVEGEKTADAAGKRLGNYVAVTWPGGSKAAAKADWRPLADREVAVWPDADDAGRRAAAEVTALVVAVGARKAVAVDLPAVLPAKWDLADAWPEGLTLTDAAAAVEAARSSSAGATGAVWPPGIRCDLRAGLFFDEQKDGSTVPHWLGAPLEVLGEGRAPDGSGWSKVVRFRNPDGVEQTMPIAMASLASGGGEVRAALADAGYTFDTGRGRMDRLTSALMRVRAPGRMTLVSATGWVGERFVLPGRTIGANGRDPIMFVGESPSLKYRQAGSHEGWRDQVAAMADGNDLLAFAISAAFAAPLLRVLGGEGGGFHFRGFSSWGKSVLLLAAGSVWGGDGGKYGFAHTWRATANALETLASAHNDVLLCLDEFAQIDPAEAGASAYTLANGQGKARQNANTSLRKRAEWLLLLLSTGEVSLADHIASSPKGGRAAVGQEVRLVDVSADGGSNMGIWQTLHGVDGPAQMSEQVEAAARRHYGHAGPRFLERLTADRQAAEKLAVARMAAFLTEALGAGGSGQVRRVGQRFGLIAAAGELAIAWGIVPWAPGTAASAALALHRRWASAFGQGAPREEVEMVKRLREVIQSERSAFSPVGDDDLADTATPSSGGRDGEARQLKTLGFRHVRGAEVHYLLHDHGWQYVFRGFDLRAAQRAIEAAGFLVTVKDGSKKRYKKDFRIRGEKQHLYCVRSTILEAMPEDDDSTWPTIRTDQAVSGETNARAAAERSADWQERAAIYEFDAGLSRADAERLTAAELGSPSTTPTHTESSE